MNKQVSFLLFSSIGMLLIGVALINTEPIYSLIFDLKVEKALVIYQGKANSEDSSYVKTQHLKVKHLYEGKEYTHKVNVDVVAQKFFKIGDSIEISYKVGRPETVKNNYTDWSFFVVMLLAWFFLFYIFVTQAMDYRTSSPSPRSGHPNA
ncbi:hypothetical protein WAF17_08135 [Bernardetia sp. ABR2-2B]|uniref:hypothetical protein n=1 Tax=Bernardetia sp. ABR2-2B TaxID=3127472 RepID=UPI0030D28AEE